MSFEDAALTDPLVENRAEPGEPMQHELPTALAHLLGDQVRAVDQCIQARHRQLADGMGASIVTGILEGR